MKSKKGFYTIVASIAFILILLVIYRITSNNADASKKPGLVALVVTSKPQRNDVTKTQLFTGDILPIQQASIYSKASGNLEKIYTDIGQFVKQGQVLALIDTTIYSQNTKQSYASLLQAEANLQNMKLTYDRNKSLLEQKLISRQDLDNSKASYDIAVAQKEFAQANYKNSQTQLSYCKITAPFSGFITKRFLDAGAYITTSTTQSSSTLFTLMDLDIVKVMANIPEKEIPYLNTVKEVMITADALPGKEFPAQIKKMSQAVDLASRTLAVEIDIVNKDHSIKPGMFANVNFVLERKKNVLTLPLEAVQQDDKGDYIYTVSSDTVAHRKYITSGIKQESIVEITSGVDENDRVVTVGQTLLKDNLKVKITK